MSSGNSVSQKRRCDGCGIQFQPRLDGALCPACVEIVIANNLEKDDWEQYKLREEYEAWPRTPMARGQKTPVVKTPKPCGGVGGDVKIACATIKRKSPNNGGWATDE